MKNTNCCTFFSLFLYPRLGYTPVCLSLGVFFMSLLVPEKVNQESLLANWKRQYFATSTVKSAICTY